MIVLYLFIVTGLTIAFVFEAAAMKSRILLNTNSHDAYAVTINKIFLLLNRFGIALCMPLFGLLIDLGTPARRIALLFSVGFIAAFLMIKLTVAHSETSDRVTRWLMKRIFSVDIHSIELTAKKLKLKSKGFMVGSLTSAGVSVPAVSASLYPEYSTFLIQTGFLINSLAAILNVFVIDVSNTKSLNSNVTDSTILDNINSKAYAYLIFSVILLGVWIVLNG